LGLVTAIQWSGGVGRSLVEWNARVDAGTVPALRINHGRLEVRGEQPFVRQEPGGLLIIDTTGVHTALADSVPAGLLVLTDRAVFRPSVGVNRTYEFKGQHIDFWLDGSGLRRLRSLAVPAVLLLGTPVAFLYFALINLSLVLILVGAAILADRLFGNRVGLPFKVLLRLGLFVVTPVALAYKFLGLLAPGPAEALLPFYPAVTAFLLLGAVRLCAGSVSGESD
ncbi:MAG: hypothetical protein SGI90_12785, partial [Candidatus Eisenbacteria bacterium]|nr:hypothetical protein [Candidatus Eisenbacteria bacterium]